MLGNCLNFKASFSAQFSMQNKINLDVQKLPFIFYGLNIVQNLTLQNNQQTTVIKNNWQYPKQNPY